MKKRHLVPIATHDSRIILQLLVCNFTGVTLPDHWSPMTGSVVYQLIQLATTDKEYQTVFQEFQRTCTRQVVKVSLPKISTPHKHLEFHQLTLVVGPFLFWSQISPLSL